MATTTVTLAHNNQVHTIYVPQNLGHFKAAYTNRILGGHVVPSVGALCLNQDTDVLQAGVTYTFHYPPGTVVLPVVVQQQDCTKTKKECSQDGKDGSGVFGRLSNLSRYLSYCSSHSQQSASSQDTNHRTQTSNAASSQENSSGATCNERETLLNVNEGLRRRKQHG